MAVSTAALTDDSVSLYFHSTLDGYEVVYPVLKRKSCHATTWVKLEGIMPTETSQSQKDEYCMIPLM